MKKYEDNNWNGIYDRFVEWQKRTNFLPELTEASFKEGADLIRDLVRNKDPELALSVLGCFKRVLILGVLDDIPGLKDCARFILKMEMEI